MLRKTIVIFNCGMVANHFLKDVTANMSQAWFGNGDLNLLFYKKSKAKWTSLETHSILVFLLGLCESQLKFALFSICHGAQLFYRHI